jgi:ABC-type glycerol-3-phosphate transport system permease component
VSAPPVESRRAADPLARLAAAVRPAARRLRRASPWSVLGFLMLSALAASTLYPIVFVVFTSLKTPEEYARATLAPPAHPTAAFIVQAWAQANVAQLSLNSLVVVSGGVGVIVAVSTLGGWALSGMRFRFRDVTLLGIVGLMMLPAPVLMIPLFTVVRDLGLFNSRLGLVLVYAAWHAPFATYLMTAYMQGIPRDLVEAAECDGAGPLRTFWSVTLPLARPAILAVVTLTFLWLWNELLFALVILQDEGQRTLMVGLATLQGRFSTPPPLLAAGMLLSMAPALLVFALFQRNLATGLTAGAVK